MLNQLDETHRGTRYNLLDGYKAAGVMTHAIPLFQRVLDDARRELGEQHPRTLAARVNLAEVRKPVGNPARRTRWWRHG